MTSPSGLAINRTLVLDLWNNGLDTKEIADDLGVPESVIYNTLAKMSGSTAPAPEKRRRQA